MERGMDELGGKVAVITGAGRGMAAWPPSGSPGEACGLRWSRAAPASSPKHSKRSRQKAAEAIAIPADLGSPQSVAAMKAEVESRLGAPSILSTPPAYSGRSSSSGRPILTTGSETVMVNTVGPYLICHAFVDKMVRAGWGRIVNVTSAAALHEPGPINSAYGTSKAALNQFTRHLAAEIAGSGVTANVIHPGDVKTEMWADIREGAADLGPGPQRYQRMGRLGRDDRRRRSRKGERPHRGTPRASAAGSINGRFLWIKDGLQPPIPSWGEFPRPKRGKPNESGI